MASVKGEELEPTVQERCDRFEDALERYETYDGEARTGAIDILTDMMHYAKSRRWDFPKMLTMAEIHFNEETS